MANVAATSAQRADRPSTIRNPGVVARQLLSRGALHALTLGVGALLMVPFAWALIGSFKPEDEVKAMPPTFLPTHWMPGDYLIVWSSSFFTHWFANTVEIAVLATLGTVLSAAAAGYAFARLRFPGRRAFFGMTIATMLLPFEVKLIPNYLEFYKLGWLNTYLPLTVPFWLGGGAFYIFLFRQFFMTIPLDLERRRRSTAPVTSRSWPGSSCRSRCRCWPRRASSRSSTTGTPSSCH